MCLTKGFKKCAIILSIVLVLSFMTMGDANASLTTGSKFLGNIIASSAPSNFATYWNQVTPENGGKWGSVEGSRDVMSWGQCDTSYNYAKSHSFPFKFHCLVWGSQQPSWISSLSAADQKTEVQEWIAAAGAKYPDAQYVDVVNEPLHAVPSYSNALGGGGSTGWDWIVWSFQQARTAFPNSKLLINEYGIISDPNAANNYVNIINILKARGLVDGIGIQCHQFNMDTVSTSTMTSVLNTLSATGLPIYVSELDMTGDDATQLSRYQQKFPVLWEHSNVKGITLWGYIQGQTWKDNTWLIRSDGSERPAMTWLKSYFGSGSTPTPTPTPGGSTPTPTPTPGGATATPTPGSGTTVQCESMTIGGTYAGTISSPFAGVALYANNDYCAYTQYFANSTHSFSVRGASNNSSTARVDLKIGGTTVGSLYFTGTTPTVQTLNNITHGTGNQEVRLTVTTDTGAWDAYVDYIQIN